MQTDSKRMDSKRLTQMALLIAIIVLMAFTPLGYLKTAGVEITFIMIPVVIGAIVLGPGAGALLGAVFGATSFIQCFGMSAFGTMLLQTNWFYTFVACMVPRVLMGWLSGLIFRLLYRRDKTKLASFAVASLSGALLNTLFFVASIGLLFYNTMLGMATQSGVSVLSFMLTFITFNTLLESVVCLVIGTAVSKAVYKIVNRNQTHTLA